MVEAAQGLPLLQETHHHGHEEPGAKPAASHHEEEASPEPHQGGNPHIWLDPVLAQDICRKIAAAFIQADPATAPNMRPISRVIWPPWMN